MKIYVAIAQYYYETKNIVGCYSTRQLAEEVLRKAVIEDKNIFHDQEGGVDYYIEEFELDSEVEE